MNHQGLIIISQLIRLFFFNKHGPGFWRASAHRASITVNTAQTCTESKLFSCTYHICVLCGILLVFFFEFFTHLLFKPVRIVSSKQKVLGKLLTLNLLYFFRLLFFLFCLFPFFSFLSGMLDTAICFRLYLHYFTVSLLTLRLLVYVLLRSILMNTLFFLLFILCFLFFFIFFLCILTLLFVIFFYFHFFSNFFLNSTPFCINM